ncbi:TBC1 domain family member 19-like isoform X2 [Xenia sp. Carnegie-2017]|uniref:TBC1 domain family member 19-like isoform X2 n=1 Tax=Xenia sp. Carnegie-2017 TaxID=2897299 RepID=UPI001F04B14B|nr:TBC1 domain family member 19-like isoform X2 [Xenia sp. Carnegie-2017]
MMADEKDVTLYKSRCICSYLRTSKLYFEIANDLKEQISKPNAVVEDLNKFCQSYIENSTWSTKIQNAVYQQLRRLKIDTVVADQKCSKEPLHFLQKAQRSWEKRVLKSINSMCTELSLPLARKRSPKDQAALLSKFNTLGSECDMTVLNKIRPVYSTIDFMEVVLSVRNPNYTPLKQNPNLMNGWGRIQVQLKVKTISELRVFFKEIEQCGSQYGAYDGETNSKDLSENDWYKLGKRVIDKESCPSAQQYAKSGCPSSIRRHIWALLLDIGEKDQNKLHFETLKSYVCKYDLLVDILIKKDIKSTATNDDQYFVFEDLLYQVLMAFARDTKVLRYFEGTPANPPRSYIRGKLGIEEYAVYYPPNGVIPFHGFSMYAAPLCYIYEDPSSLYHAFRGLFTRYFMRLHNISSHPQGIVSLCLLFETLLQTLEPDLFYHLRQIGFHPVKTAFNWIFYVFSGYLESEQVLTLWDRILGYDSLEVLSVLAHSIFSFRGKSLLDVTSPGGAEAVLNDITDIKVVPLLQRTLFL